MFFYSFIGVILIIYLFIVFKRTKKYGYDPAKDHLYTLQPPFLQNIVIKQDFMTLPLEHKDFDTLFLKISLAFHPLSYFFKPSIEIEGSKHFFEYGAQGDRYLNISHTKNEHLRLLCRNLKLKTGESTLYGYKNEIDLSKKILILAPHADDSEIAAFGLYKSAKDVTIVTTTIGEHGVCNYCDLYENKTQAALKKAELRTFDALSVPVLGGVVPENSLTLGYYGGSLKWMSEHPKEDASSFIEGFGDMNSFRKVSHSYLDLSVQVRPTYDSFLHDLELILTQVQPEYIITPHPAIDSHPDHKYTTQALIDALKKTELPCKLLAYTNHLTLSETYPVGPMHTSVNLPPNFDEFYFDGVYSFELDEELQQDKLFALEAIHDLRDSLLSVSVKRAYKHLKRLIKRTVTGKDKSYFKRAVRANELFFVIESKNIERL
ncbi:PIG-L family deacetylase [Sulfurimonas sp. HSL-1716]|uniref:PIG-L deacetylase family protein n=1 Tax=Hydrocurvibacter sulfurireducens TaxID=3131937 RepID=UPI0031F9F0C3